MSDVPVISIAGFFSQKRIIIINHTKIKSPILFFSIKKMTLYNLTKMNSESNVIYPILILFGVLLKLRGVAGYYPQYRTLGRTSPRPPEVKPRPDESLPPLTCPAHTRARHTHTHVHTQGSETGEERPGTGRKPRNLRPSLLPVGRQDILHQHATGPQCVGPCGSCREMFPRALVLLCLGSVVRSQSVSKSVSQG